MELCSLTGWQIKELISKKEVSAVAVVEDLFRHIAKTEPSIKAYLTLTQDYALVQAGQIDARIARGEQPGLLAGIPVAIKDNIATDGIRTTCGSKILANFVPPYDAYVIKRIKEEDGIIIGKTNLDEFAMGSSCENSAFGPTANPRDVSRVPGGSSGGSAAAVASDMACMALGSDTGGSIRQPAALCGITGLKPTYGCVSRYGLVAFASSLDQIGPLTKDTRDAALLMNVIAGYDKQDSTSVNRPVPDFTKGLDGEIRGLKIGVPKEYFGQGLNEDIRDAVNQTLSAYEKLGAKLVEVSLPHTNYGIATYYIIAPSEACSNLARYDGIHYGYRATPAYAEASAGRDYTDLINMYSKSRSEGFGHEVKRRIMLGTFALSSGYYEAYYNRALKIRRLIKQDFDAAFNKVDVIMGPTSPIAAFKAGEKLADPLQMYLCDVYTVTANLAGIPGISIPCGLTKEKLPVGLQILGKAFDEATLLKVARAYENVNSKHQAPNSK
ncbi:MAG: Asp-tRNA(Asn)/Glu-tRNA(Gln) amidotransferase subunit GatA [Planctomycetes bacterium]|nr:Asp-tRNA(Asn)/Glu-tRNA(Gln) amidotransferase subunit GatA [Planctomycetota bacterium]